MLYSEVMKMIILLMNGERCKMKDAEIRDLFFACMTANFWLLFRHFCVGFGRKFRQPLGST
jgi:hypothetical protein